MNLTKHLKRAYDPQYQPKGKVPGTAYIPLDVRRVDEHVYVESGDQRLFCDSELRLLRLLYKVADGDQVVLVVDFQTDEDLESDAIHIVSVVDEDSGYPIFPLSDDCRAFLTELVRQQLAVEELR